MARSRKERKRLEEKRAKSIPKTKYSSICKTSNTTTATVPIASLGPMSYGSILTFGDPLSKEETRELTLLTEEHLLKTKLLKIEYFKKVPSEVRQEILNIITWQQYKKDISQIESEKTDRHKALESKKNSSNIFISGGTAWFSASYDIYSILLPDGITLSELKQAHIDSLMEEQVLDGQN
jgi:hypothetical protein